MTIALKKVYLTELSAMLVKRRRELKACLGRVRCAMVSISCSYRSLQSALSDEWLCAGSVRALQVTYVIFQKRYFAASASNPSAVVASVSLDLSDNVLSHLPCITLLCRGL